MKSEAENRVNTGTTKDGTHCVLMLAQSASSAEGTQSVLNASKRTVHETKLDSDNTIL